MYLKQPKNPPAHLVFLKNDVSKSLFKKRLVKSKLHITLHQNNTVYLEEDHQVQEQIPEATHRSGGPERKHHHHSQHKTFKG